MEKFDEKLNFGNRAHLSRGCQIKKIISCLLCQIYCLPNRNILHANLRYISFTHSGCSSFIRFRLLSAAGLLHTHTQLYTVKEFTTVPCYCGACLGMHRSGFHVGVGGGHWILTSPILKCLGRMGYGRSRAM